MFRRLAVHSRVWWCGQQARRRLTGSSNGTSPQTPRTKVALRILLASASLGAVVGLNHNTRQREWSPLHIFDAITDSVVVKAKKAKESVESDCKGDGESDDEEPSSNNSLSRSKPGFRDRKIMEYENRIRQYSTPDKVFRYFASVKVIYENGEVEIFMTPQDFLRSITPGIMQPQGYGLDHYKKIEAKNISKSTNPCVAPNLSAFPAPFEGMSENSVFYRLSASGLISFSDYIFLLTILSASKRHFEIAFRMIDLNGDGDIDYDEFEKVQEIIRNQTSIGSRHRDHQGTGNIYRGVSSALCTFFFGENLDKKLTVDRFLDFQRELQTEILTLEFLRHDPENGKIPEWEFAELLITYAGLSEKKKNKMIKRIKKLFKESSQGITLFDYLQFFHFLNNITEVDTALTFYHIAGASIDPPTLKHVAQTVAHVELRDHVINVLFALFDENMDGQLSNREFVSVMKERLHRGLEKPKDTGFVKLLSSLAKCARPKKVAVVPQETTT